MRAVASGATETEAAAKPGIALSVVKAHLGKIYAKWRVRSRTEAAIKFTQGGGVNGQGPRTKDQGPRAKGQGPMTSDG